MLRIDVGIMAKAVDMATKETKEKFGRLTYTYNAIRQAKESNYLNFKITIDGKTLSETGVALMITNVGNIGISNFSLPKVKVTDGLLDVILLKTISVESAYTLLRSVLKQKKPKGSVKHWKAKNVQIHIKPSTQIMCDDLPIKSRSIKATVVPGSLTVVVP
jgi:diacylglycerol kinase (ATP)